MKLVVCLKPIRAGLLYPNDDKYGDYVFNPYDQSALEIAIKLKESIGGVVICICMGPKEVSSVMRKALAMGADDIVLVCDKRFAGSDTIATSYVLAETIKQIRDVDLIFAGEKTIDGETGQVVYGVAERLGVSCFSGVCEVMEVNDRKLTFCYEEDNVRYTANVNLPAMIGVGTFKMMQPDISLMKMKKAMRQEMEVWTFDDINQLKCEKCGVVGSKTKVREVRNNIKKGNLTLIEGTLEEKAEKILRIIQGKRD